jgi:type 2 lantibiotic biosynthesis protein LanM
MTDPRFEKDDWYRAVSFADRLATLRATGRETPPDLDAAVAERRFRRWRTEGPLADDDLFAKRLAQDDLAEEQLRALLGEPAGAVRQRFSEPPAWLASVARAFATATGERLVPEAAEGQAMVGFLALAEPLLLDARRRLQEDIADLSPDAFDPEAVAPMLLNNLLEPLLGMVSRTLVLEMRVARLQGQLEGETADERFHSFVERLRDPEIALPLLEEYPVLAQQLAISLDQWVEVNLEFLQRLSADWPEIRAAFWPDGDPGQLTEAHGGAGDGHCGGRSVMVLGFSSGARLVYKPRSLAGDAHFQQLLAWLNERGDHPAFRTISLLDRGDYGWMEFIEAAGCESEVEVRRFYQRQGGYLALLYGLEATDFHFENLVAAGEQPMLLDLEALFHPRVGAAEADAPHAATHAAFRNSVLSIGLLPERIWGGAESEGVDISGLGMAAGQLSPFSVPTWEGTGTDEMRLTRARIEMTPGRNRPTLAGADVDLIQYQAELLEGFTRVYRLLLRHREELLAPDGPLAAFAEDEVRVIFRGTAVYDSLLKESFHPDLLRDGLDRDRLFDRLWGSVVMEPHLERLIPAELADMRQGDIPRFTTQPASSDAITSRGERLPDFFPETGLELVRKRLQQLGEADLARQLWFIRASLATLSTEVEVMRLSGYDLFESADAEGGTGFQPVKAHSQDGCGTGEIHRREACATRILAAARSIGDRLEELACGVEDQVAWVSLAIPDGKRWSLVPVGTDLYEGLPGIALFLAHLGAATGEERYTDLARAAATSFRRQVEAARELPLSPGAFDGWGGTIYALAHLGAIWNDTSLWDEAEALLDRLPESIDLDQAFDVISGSAGCISALAALYRCRPSERMLEAMVRCGERLLAGAEPAERGIGWKAAVVNAKPLSGFSHGAAGIARALLEVAALSGQERFREAAVQAIDYERSLFCKDQGNWRDERDLSEIGIMPDSGEHCGMSWCHGAPGVGMGRLLSLPYLDDAAVRTEIETAIETTLHQGFGMNHGLCHGDLGNLETLLMAGEILGDSRCRAATNGIAEKILASIDRHGPLCATPGGVETPGLMLGLAGIGYGLLRLADPTRVPSVLALAAPAPVR